jgi:hypothetical protein
MENFEPQQNQPLSKNEELRLINAIQLQLMNRMHPEQKISDQLKWIETHSAEFRQMITQQPQLLSDYRFQEYLTLEKMEDVLYHRTEKKA